MRRNLLAYVRLAGWIALLAALHLPWRSLGGIVDERLRWLERWALAGGVIAGAWAGAEVRARDVRPARVVALAPTGAAALAALVLELGGDAYGALVAVVAAVAFAAGFDLGRRPPPLSSAPRRADDATEELEPD